MGAAWIADFLAQEQLPASFRATIDGICEPLAAYAEALRRDRGATAVIGLCGAQGSGKSTIAAAAARLLQDRGLNAVTLSLDDVYLARRERERLAREVHPLFVTRGPPGTHDVDLACATLDRLRGQGEVALPAFDKSLDDRRPRETWRRAAGPADVVIFEGWCVGASPKPAAALTSPVNALEAQEDPDGRWRGRINAELAGPYQALFARLDALALLMAPSFDVVFGWRREQERKLIARTGRGMSEAQLARFVAHYERLTRWIMTEAPGRAQLVFRQAEDRRGTL